MEHTIQHITDRLVELLPEHDQYYRLDELKDLGFPLFIVHRIKVELERNLEESIVPPKTDWANMNTDRVQDAWHHFLSAIRAEARLPASYAHSVIETAVADVLEMLIQPRKNVPEVIFGTDEELAPGELSDRLKAVVVYRHFVKLLDRYVKKKDLSALSKERCREIISRADARLTERYSPLNWAQMLEPLFNLLNEQVDTNLLRLFFEDKKMPRVARHFDLMDSKVNRAQLIESLSSPELLNLEGYEDDQSNLFPGQDLPAEDEEKKEITEEQESSEGGESESTGQEDPRGPGDDDIVSSFHKSRDKKIDSESEENPGDENDDGDLNTVFGIEAADEESRDNYKETPDANYLNDIFAKKEESGEPETAGEEIEEGERTDEKIEQHEQAEEQSEEGANEIRDVEPAREDEEEPFELKHTGDEEAEIDYPDFVKEYKENTPMWQRFLDPGQEEENEDDEKRDSTSGEESGDEGYIEEPIIDLTQEEEPGQEETDHLWNSLEDEKDRFVEEIFRGSERAFEEALEELSGFESWRSASRFIEKEIFKRNLVDMYSEAAVDFTDRLQTYFLEKSKSS